MTKAQATHFCVCAAPKRAVITAFAMCGYGHLVAG
jgi:hypothetical protein